MVPQRLLIESGVTLDQVDDDEEVAEEVPQVWSNDQMWMCLTVFMQWSLLKTVSSPGHTYHMASVLKMTQPIEWKMDTK